MTLTVISASRVSYMAISFLVAGMAMTTRIRIGMTVQMISAVVLWLKVAATAPFDLRNLNMATAMAPNTSAPITTQIHNAIMCAS